jgi:hypothetical protein
VSRRRGQRGGIDSPLNTRVDGSRVDRRHQGAHQSQLRTGASANRARRAARLYGTIPPKQYEPAAHVIAEGTPQSKSVLHGCRWCVQSIVHDEAWPSVSNVVGNTRRPERCARVGAAHKAPNRQTNPTAVARSRPRDGTAIEVAGDVQTSRSFMVPGMMAAHADAMCCEGLPGVGARQGPLPDPLQRAPTEQLATEEASSRLLSPADPGPPPRLGTSLAERGGRGGRRGGGAELSGLAPTAVMAGVVEAWARRYIQRGAAGGSGAAGRPLSGLPVVSGVRGNDRASDSVHRERDVDHDRRLSGIK